MRPVELVAALERLPATQVFHTTEEVWEALGGVHEERATPAVTPAPAHVPPRARTEAPERAEREAPPAPKRTESPERFEFRFDRLHRLLALPFGVHPGTAHVEVDRAARRLVARFGPWRVETDLSNVHAAVVTGGYFVAKTVGPAHLSLRDRGLTFATNDARGVCITFDEPVAGIDVLGIMRHPALTVTVADPERLVAALSSVSRS